jgi:hypothetical protein
VGALQERVAEGFNLGGDGVEKFGACFGRLQAIDFERGGGGVERSVDFGERSFVEIGREFFARGGIDRLENCATGGASLAGEEAFTLESGHEWKIRRWS